MHGVNASVCFCVHMYLCLLVCLLVFLLVCTCVCMCSVVWFLVMFGGVLFCLFYVEGSLIHGKT